MAKKKNLFSELEQKRELDERRFTTLNASRWSFGFQIFRAHIGRVIIINLLLLLSALYLGLIFVNRYGQLIQLYGTHPFSANLGFGYMPNTQITGLESEIILSANLGFCRQLPLAGLILGVGLSGALYVFRNMLWIEDIHVFRDFFVGIKKNWTVVILTALYSIILGVLIMCISYADYAIASGVNTWIQTFTKVICYIAIIFFSLMFLQSAVMTVTYKAKFWALCKNSFLISVILIPIHAFMLAIALIPFFLLMFGGIFMMLGIIVLVVFGLSYVVFVWTNYSHWIYERFLPQPENTQKPVKKTTQIQDNATEEKKVVVKKLPIKPFSSEDPDVKDLPSVFTFEDILAVSKSQENMRADSDAFEENAKKQAGEDKKEQE